MKKVIVAIILGAVLLGGAIWGGTALYRHLVTDRVSDYGGMENPDYTAEMEQEDNQHHTDMTE